MDKELAQMELPSDVLVEREPHFAGGWHYTFTFSNGYGASVIPQPFSEDSGLWEIGLLDSNGALLYNDERFNPYDAVCPYLDDEDVKDILRDISTFNHQIGQ